MADLIPLKTRGNVWVGVINEEGKFVESSLVFMNGKKRHLYGEVRSSYDILHFVFIWSGILFFTSKKTEF